MVKNNEGKWWELIRNGELSTALEFFPNIKNLKILEIGGRDGFQAEIIAKKGYNVTSIDFPNCLETCSGEGMSMEWFAVQI